MNCPLKCIDINSLSLKDPDTTPDNLLSAKLPLDLATSQLQLPLSDTLTMPTIPDTSWTTVSYAQVLQKNLQSPTALVPRTMRKQTAKSRKDSMEVTTLWEDSTYRAKNLVSKATTLLQNDLRLGAVVFDFPTDEFVDSAAAYECIQEQIGEAPEQVSSPQYQDGPRQRRPYGGGVHVCQQGEHQEGPGDEDPDRIIDLWENTKRVIRATTNPRQ
ncbi:hypothetical protein BC940DRAFT_323779 [Gongronella butleri]|nr:hypothetical protein BC940DRAFT_323779 [Gongronella butleri]